MNPLWRQRVREWCCRHFGHRLSKDTDNRVVTCSRCHRLLAGPVNWEDFWTQRTSA